jgi:hypothetical protein
MYKVLKPIGQLEVGHELEEEAVNKEFREGLIKDGYIEPIEPEPIEPEPIEPEPEPTVEPEPNPNPVPTRKRVIVDTNEPIIKPSGRKRNPKKKL